MRILYSSEVELKDYIFAIRSDQSDLKPPDVLTSQLINTRELEPTFIAFTANCWHELLTWKRKLTREENCLHLYPL